MTKQGLIIVSDRRIFDRLGVTYIQKINQISKFSAFINTGTIEFSIPHSDLKFNPTLIMKNFFLKNPEIGDGNLKKLIKVLKVELNKYFKNNLLESKDLHTSNDPLFNTIFFYYDKINNTYGIKLLEFYYKKDQFNNYKVYGYLGDLSKEHFLFSHSYIFGNISVFNQIKSGSDKWFKGIQKKYFAQKFIKNQINEICDYKEIIEFSKYLIKVSNERGCLLPPYITDVGSIVDVVLIDKDKGFRIIESNYQIPNIDNLIMRLIVKLFSVFRKLQS